MQTNSTPYADINELLELLLSAMQNILGNKLVGLYFYGSLVTEDFDYGSSDFDVLAATSSDIDAREFEALQKRPTDFADTNKQCEGKVEVQ